MRSTSLKSSKILIFKRLWLVDHTLPHIFQLHFVFIRTKNWVYINDFRAVLWQKFAIKGASIWSKFAFSNSLSLYSKRKRLTATYNSAQNHEATCTFHLSIYIDGLSGDTPSPFFFLEIISQIIIQQFLFHSIVEYVLFFMFHVSSYFPKFIHCIKSTHIIILKWVEY